MTMTRPGSDLTQGSALAMLAVSEWEGKIRLSFTAFAPGPKYQLSAQNQEAPPTTPACRRGEHPEVEEAHTAPVEEVEALAAVEVA